MANKKNRQKKFSLSYAWKQRRMREAALRATKFLGDGGSIDEHCRPQDIQRNTEDSQQQNDYEILDGRNEEMIIDEVIVIDSIDRETVENPQRSVKDIESESEGFSGEGEVKLDSAFCSSIDESPGWGQQSPRPGTIDDENINERNERHKLDNDELETSLSENERQGDSGCCGSAGDLSTQSLEDDKVTCNLQSISSDGGEGISQSPDKEYSSPRSPTSKYDDIDQQKDGNDVENNDLGTSPEENARHCVSGDDGDDDEDDDDFHDAAPYFEEYGDSWNLPHVHGRTQPYSTGGYFEDDENILPNIVDGKTDENRADVSSEVSAEEEISLDSTTRENTHDEGDIFSKVARNKEKGHIYTDAYSGDDNESIYTDTSSNGEEETSTDTPPYFEKRIAQPPSCSHNLRRGKNRRRERRKRGRRNDQWQGSASEQLYHQNIKNGKQRYSRQLAKEIEKTFTDDCIQGGNLGGRVVCSPLELFRFLLGYVNFHNHFCQSIGALKLDSVFAQGMRELYTFTCSACEFSFKIWSDYAINATPLHEAVILGSLTAGIGYNVTQEILSSMGVTCISDKIYRATREALSPVVKKISTKSMKAAAKRERRLAIKAGDVIKGVPFITVIVDGAWSKRSYKGGLYNALSGVAVIVGYRTRKVLYCSTMNKYCKFCEVAAKNKVKPGIHNCARNYSRQDPSSAMEPKILLEGFIRSIADYGVIYKYIIGDGDSSVYSSIMDYDPYARYDVEVIKIECVNHLFRRFCTVLKEISRHTLAMPLPRGKVGSFRKAVHDSTKPLRNLIGELVDYWDNKDLTLEQKAQHIRDDIPKIIRHYFGDHSNCPLCVKDCPPQGSMPKENIWSNIVKVNWEKDIDSAASRLQNNAKNLLLRCTNNAAEGFHSIGNKTLGGRRVNHTATDDYTLRQHCSAIQYNSKHVLSDLHEETGKIPIAVQKMEQQKINQGARTALSRANNRRIRHRGGGFGEDSCYGLNSDQYLSEDEFILRKNEILAFYESNKERRNEIERLTVSQRHSAEWISLHRKMITASFFGGICRMNEWTSCKNKVKQILYQGKLHSEHIQFGQDNEAKALEALEEQIHVKIQPCGLFIDEQFPYLGATPDGLVSDDGIVEVKCLSSARHLHPDEAIKVTHKSLFGKDGKMNKRHVYFYQVQGQLHITQRSYCIFAIWTPIGIKHLRVERDDEFWKTEMEFKLTRFFTECILRERIEKTILGKKPFEDPQYIRDAKLQRDQLQVNKKQARKRRRDEDSEREKERASTDLRTKRRKPTQGQSDSVASCSDVGVSGEDDCDNLNIGNSTSGEYEDADQNYCTADGVTSSEITHGTDHEQFDIDNREVRTQEEFDADIEMSVSAISKETALESVRNGNKLSSEAVDYFLKILRNNTEGITIFFATNFAYPHYTTPSLTNHDVHIMGGGLSDHWRCLYFNNGQLILYDSSEQVPLNADELAYIKKRYPHHAHTLQRRSVTQQPDLVSCGVYAIAYAVTLAQGRRPEDINYSRSVQNMRHCLRFIMSTESVIPFPEDRIG